MPSRPGRRIGQTAPQASGRYFWGLAPAGARRASERAAYLIAAGFQLRAPDFTRANQCKAIAQQTRVCDAHRIRFGPRTPSLWRPSVDVIAPRAPCWCQQRWGLHIELSCWCMVACACHHVGVGCLNKTSALTADVAGTTFFAIKLLWGQLAPVLANVGE